MKWIFKNKKIRNLYKLLEIKKLLLKSLLIYNKEKIEKKFFFNKLFHRINYDSSISKIRNFCINLNNSKSIFRKFKLSRHKIKLLAANGFITGLRKSSF